VEEVVLPPKITKLGTANTPWALIFLKYFTIYHCSKYMTVIKEQLRENKFGS
jgi:hypothetical protein